MSDFKTLAVFLWLLPLFSVGQMKPGMRNLDNQNVDTTEEEEKEKKVPVQVKSWKVYDYGAAIDSFRLDTLLKNYHDYLPVYKNSITSAYTGNYGGAYLDNDFYARNYHSEFYLFQTHDAYLLTPSKINYFNTTTPLTILDYSQSENKNRNNETRLNVLHSQNVTPKLNFTLRYDQAKSDGQYNFQENKNHFITLYSSYNSDKLDVYGGIIFNRIFNDENGGMQNDGDLGNVESEYVVMRLTDAGSVYKNSYYFASGEYKLGTRDTSESKDSFRPFASVIYSFLLSNNLRMFWEGEEGDNSGFFPDSYMNPDFTRDSVRFRSVTNLIQLKFHESPQKKYSFGKRAFAGVELDRSSYAAPGYSQPIYPFHPGDYDNNGYSGPPARWNTRSYSNIFVGGGIFRRAGKFWNWNFNGRQYLTGFKAGQTELNGTISKPIHLLKDSLSLFVIKGNLWNLRPDYFQQDYFSNRVKWNNDLVNEQVMNASCSVITPGKHLDAGFRYSLINNFIYHDTLGIPAQTKNELLILSAYLDKEFHLGNFTLATHCSWQKASSVRFIHLPDLQARVLLSYDMVLSKVLFVQLGADVRYNTRYYADAYQPATGFFYLQDEKMLGNYPYADAFANLKLKRTRVFFQYMNIGSLGLKPEYFTALHYPMNKATFRMGVAWSFYD